MIIGLTGRSGSGKSTVAALFADAGFRLIDCDALVHSLDHDRDYTEKIRANFGADYAPDGVIDRARLGALVFSDRTALERLNAVIAPFIYHKVCSEMDRAEKEGVDAVLDAPLLFEYGLDARCDITVGVIASPEETVRRIAMRDGKSETEILGRMAAQHDNEFFRAKCDRIIVNEGGYDTLKQNFERILAGIEKRRAP